MRRTSLLLFAFTFLSFLRTPDLHSQTTMFGGRGMLRVLSAEVVKPADIYLNAYFLSYFKKRSPQHLDKDYTLNITTTIGVFKNFELLVRLVPYQDDQKHIWGPMGDTELGFKYHIPFPIPVVHIGVKAFYSFPTAPSANVPYEPFSTSDPSWGALALLTFNLSDYSPLVPLKIHGNIGYLDHSIGGPYFKDEKDQMLLGYGLQFPIRSMQFYTEYTAEVFTNRKDSVSFRENSMRLSAGIKFLGPRKIILDLAFDIGLTRYGPRKGTTFYFKEYADWKIIVGATYSLSVLHRLFDKSRKIAKMKKEAERRKLEKIKVAREKANEEMTKLKEMLEKKKRAKTP